MIVYPSGRNALEWIQGRQTISDRRFDFHRGFSFLGCVVVLGVGIDVTNVIFIGAVVGSGT